MSPETTGAAEPYAALGAYLTAYEASRLALLLDSGDTITRALKEIHSSRRNDVRRLLTDADLGPHRADTTVAVLRAVAGARSVRAGLTPVWTMPGSEATIGRLTSEARRLIDDARMSIVCSSFNFTPNSQMWPTLRAASLRPEISVTVYLDAARGSPRTVAEQLPHAAVYQTRTLPGEQRPLVSHAKFIIIDRTITLLTSANFSYNAENSNIELGLQIEDTALAGSIETLMRNKHGTLYERVDPHT
jgi:phosphatidylserine/phosphatidylglycerophosphate/cardiolipin synthase-like enzyme